MATGSRKDDDKDRHMPVYNGGGDTLRRIELITGTGRRRRWDAETKGRLVAESFDPGRSVSEVARRHDISPSLLFLWRRQAAEAMKNAESNVRGGPASTAVPRHIAGAATSSASFARYRTAHSRGLAIHRLSDAADRWSMPCRSKVAAQFPSTSS